MAKNKSDADKQAMHIQKFGDKKRAESLEKLKRKLGL